jgi:ribosome maturation factor RimP
MSENSGLINRLTELIQPICEDLGFELVAIHFRRESHGQVLRVVIYHKDGITVDDCAKVSREVSYLLDVEDFIDLKYHLEVSSPGLDWPLTTERDFNRYLGEKCTVSWYTPDGTAKVTGVIRSATDGLLVLATEQENQEIPLSRIIKARLVIEF